VFDAAVVAESTGSRLFLCCRPSDVASRVRCRVLMRDELHALKPVQDEQHARCAQIARGQSQAILASIALHFMMSSLCKDQY